MCMNIICSVHMYAYVHDNQNRDFGLQAWMFVLLWILSLWTPSVDLLLKYTVFIVVMTDVLNRDSFDIIVINFLKSQRKNFSVFSTSLSCISLHLVYSAISRRWIFYQLSLHAILCSLNMTANCHLDSRNKIKFHINIKSLAYKRMLSDTVQIWDIIFLTLT